MSEIIDDGYLVQRQLPESGYQPTQWYLNTTKETKRSEPDENGLVWATKVRQYSKDMETFTDYEEPFDLTEFCCTNLRFCGCGQPEDAARFLLRLLELAPFYEDVSSRALDAMMPTSGNYWLTLYMLTDMDLIEHGGNASGSWLTDKGKAVMKFLTEKLNA